MKKLVYNSAPLPFMGQKRRFVGEFKKALGQFPNATVFVDLFGGSGLLSHVAKQERPDVQVVYNDFDDFHLRLQNIPRTNALLADIRNFVGGGKFPRSNDCRRHCESKSSTVWPRKKKPGLSIILPSRDRCCSLGNM